MRLELNVKPLLFAMLFCLFLLKGQVTFAQTITINQPLDFGRFALTDNSVPRNITLLGTGAFVSDPEYLFFIDPSLGNVTVDGYPPSSTLTVTIGTTTLNPVGAGTANFSTSGAFTNPSVVNTDATGSATFDVGAVMTSDGSGATHTDVNYNGMFTVMVTP